MAFYNSIASQIEAIKKKEISYRALHQKAILNDKTSGTKILIPYEDILRKYRYLLQPLIISVDYSEADQMRNVIRYNPKKFSNMLYRTPELWQELLIINNCVSIVDFDKQIYKAYDSDALPGVLSEIMRLENILE